MSTLTIGKGGKELTEVPAEYLAGTVSEAEFQRTVIELAHTYGWLVHAERPARTMQGWRTPIQGDIGFPDLVMARDGRVIFAELKREKGRLTRGQYQWQNEIQGLAARPSDGEWTQESYVWRPSGIEKIEEILR